MSTKQLKQRTLSFRQTFQDRLLVTQHNPEQRAEFLLNFSQDYDVDVVAPELLSFLEAPDFIPDRLVQGVILSYLAKNNRLPSTGMEQIIKFFSNQTPLTDDQKHIIHRFHKECYHLCEAVVKAVKDKPLRIYCLLQALRMTENQKRELSLVDCIFMERSYSDHYYDIALPYAKRPIFGIVSTEIDSKHIAEYFLNSARICSKCGDYEAALLQAKLGLSTYEEGHKEYLNLVRYYDVLSIINSPDIKPKRPSNLPSSVNAYLNDEYPEFSSIIGAFFPQSSHLSSQSTDFLTLMSKRSPEPEVLSSLLLTKQSSFKDPFLFELATIALQKLSMVQHVRMMQTFGKASLRDLTYSLHTKKEENTIYVVMKASNEGVIVTVNQRDHVVTFDDDKTTSAQQKEMQHIITLYNALTQIGELSESVVELKQSIRHNKVFDVREIDPRNGPQ